MGNTLFLSMNLRSGCIIKEDFFGVDFDKNLKLTDYFE